MKEAALELDLASYRTLIYAFSVRHMVGEAEELISEMNERGLEIDKFTQSALTMLEKSWLWFSRFHVEGNMTSECYSANIDAFGERGHVLGGQKVFKCCQEKNNLSVLIKAYGINKRYDEACYLFDRMEEENGVVPDRISYNSLIQMLASAELPHVAISYVRKMQEAGFLSDCIPYCAVISSFVKLDQQEMAVDLFEEMIQWNVQPDVVVYGILINAFADVGSIKEAQEAYQMLQSSDVGADLYSSNCMIDLCSERFMVEQAEEIFENLETMECK